jgi:hypothetical protein
VYVGDDASQYSGAGGYARVLARLCHRNMEILQKQGGTVLIGAGRARIPSVPGNSAAFDGKEHSQGKWHVALILISINF